MVHADVNPKVVIITVNYHCEDEVIAFVNQISKTKRGYVRIVVVDNNEVNGGPPKLGDMLRNESNVDYVNAGENLGYFGAANRGLEEVVQQGDIPDWVIVSNPDIQIVSDFVERLATMYSPREKAIIAPTVEAESTGMDQNPFLRQRPSPARMALYEFAHKNYRIYCLYRAFSRLKASVQAKLSANGRVTDRKNRGIYAPHGSFMIINWGFFEAGGALQYEGFLFGEEIFIGEQARQLGIPVIYEPALKVVHKEHATTGNNRSRSMARIEWQSLRYLRKTYFS